MTEPCSYASGAFGLLGVIVGATITQGTAWWQKRKRHFAYWSAMSAEVDLCRDQAQGYIADQVIAPLGRLSIVAYENGFPTLLADGAVTHDEAKAVLNFYGLVEQINRGLEQANEAIAGGTKTDRSIYESMRLDVKCKHMLEANGPYAVVRGVIAHHVPSSARRNAPGEATT